MKIIFLLILLNASFSFGQESKNNAVFLDSIIKANGITNVSPRIITQNDNNYGSTSTNYYFRDGFLVFNDEFFYNLEKLVWFRINYNVFNKGKVLEIYFN